jgi:hypothetical protein
MQNRYLLLALIALSCGLAAPAAQAQQAWQPFRPGLTYQLSEVSTPGDTTHTLRLGAGVSVVGTTDSIFRFTQRIGQTSVPRNPNTNCNAWQWLRPDNLFGATLRSQPQAVFVLAAANGRTLLLRPRTPLGQSWATGQAGLSASVTSRSVTNGILGTSADSVVTITFSDGQALRLSKSYGFLEGPSLDSYLNGRNVRRALTLTALPERRLGTAVVGARATYDYQPGDVFQRTTRSFRTTLCNTQSWQQDSVLTRQVSRTGDTITYTISTRTRTGAFNVPCGSMAGSTMGPAVTSTLQIVEHWPSTASPMQPVRALPQLTSAYYGTTSRGGDLMSAVSRSSTRLAGRPAYSLALRALCTNTITADSAAITNGSNIADLEVLTRYAAGLGLTYDSTQTIVGRTVTRLTAFRKGTQTWGTFLGGTLLAAREVRPAATTAAFPSPFGETLTASFVLASAQLVGATLYDALGRPVRAVPPVLLGLGSRQLALPTAGLPAGVYTLHLTFAGEGRREILRVARAE